MFFKIVPTSEIKLVNNNDASIEYGFGPNAESFNGTPIMVGEQDAERKTAATLGYHSVDNRSLNVRNTAGGTLMVTLEFYEMD